MPDPHFHIHAYVFNATFDHKEQRWKAGQFMNLKADARAARIMEVDVKPAADASNVSWVCEYDADLNALRDIIDAKSPFFRTNLVDKDSASRIRILAPFLVLTLFLKEWRLSLEGIPKPELHPEPLKRIYALRRWLDNRSDFRELRDRGCIKMLQSDVAKASRSLNIFDLGVAFILAEKGSMADLQWGEEFEEEYARAAEHSYRALNWGFGIHG
jgi:hypothetical protein